ncbi:MAG: LacI family DNA-binding transcriptional regulator [Rhizobiaceae bacterium]
MTNGNLTGVANANVSLATIAKEVGVDPSLVSRVLRSDPSARISPKKRAHILEVVERTGYRPNRVAQSLRMRQTHILAMLTPDITNPFHSWLFRAVEARANRSGYDVILCNTDDDAERSLKVVTTLCEGHIDGLLLATARDDDPSIEMLQRRNIPYVLMNRRRKNGDDPWFGTDSGRVGRIGGEHLLSLGHKRIAYFDGDLTVEQIEGRKRGLLEVLDAADRSLDPELAATELSTRLEARNAMQTMLALRWEKRPTAVFVPRTTLVDGVLDAVHAAGLTIPDDISILGFSAVPDPVITSIRVPINEIAERAVEYLIKTLKSEPLPDDPPQVAFETTIIDRTTTAAWPS